MEDQVGPEAHLLGPSDRNGSGETLFRFTHVLVEDSEVCFLLADLLPSVQLEE